MKYAHEYIKRPTSGPDWKRYNQLHPGKEIFTFISGLIALSLLAFFTKWTLNKQPSEPMETLFAVNSLTLAFVGCVIYWNIRLEEKDVRDIQKKQLKAQFDELDKQLEEAIETQKDEEGEVGAVDIQRLCTYNISKEVGEILLPRLKSKVEPSSVSKKEEPSSVDKKEES